MNEGLVKFADKHLVTCTDTPYKLMKISYKFSWLQQKNTTTSVCNWFTYNTSWIHFTSCLQYSCPYCMLCILYNTAARIVNITLKILLKTTMWILWHNFCSSLYCSDIQLFQYENNTICIKSRSITTKKASLISKGIQSIPLKAWS